LSLFDTGAIHPSIRISSGNSWFGGGGLAENFYPEIF
jgi:hypothetical protein